MKKLQIQLPDPVYDNLRKLSLALDYSLAELLRKGAEHILSLYPQIINKSSGSEWNAPKPRNLGLKDIDPKDLREIANER